MEKITVLITGCSGLVGIHLVNKCLAKGYKVIGVDIKKSNHLPQNQNFIFGFRDLINSTDPKYWSLFDFSSIIFNDDYLKMLNSKRYNFYVKFVMGLSNPIALERFLYKTKETRNFNY